MPYVALADLKGRIPDPFLTEALDDNRDGTIDAWDTVAASVCNDVDALLSARYTVPFAEPYPPLVIRAAQVFACEMIYARRGVAPEANPWKEQADDLRAQFAKLATGEQTLIPTAAVVAGTVITEPAKLTSSSGRTLL